MDEFREKHSTLGELAELWNVHRETVRRRIKDEPGVVKLRGGPKQARTTYLVPESVARRIHTRLLNP